MSTGRCGDPPFGAEQTPMSEPQATVIVINSVQSEADQAGDGLRRCRQPGRETGN